MVEKYSDCYDAMWVGQICLKIELAVSDVSSNNQPESVFIQVSRYSYLPAALADITAHFQQHAIEFSSDMWFESNGVPLRSSLPIGVLFDQHGSNGNPWKIVVHFQAFPSFLLLKCSGPFDSEHYYFHSLKQALYLLHGTTRLFNGLAVEQQRKLWESVTIGDRVTYDSVTWALRPLALSQSPEGTSSHAISELKNIPVRIIRPDKPALQRPVQIRCRKESEDIGAAAMRQLGDVLREDFAEAWGPTASNTARCVVQGVEVPLSAPIYDLWRLMSHCDLFLYLTLRNTE